MDAVRIAEESRGCTVTDVSAAKCGWDLTSRPPGADSVERHLEVKGRIKGATSVSVTYNELMSALNQPDKFALALVLAALGLWTLWRGVVAPNLAQTRNVPGSVSDRWRYVPVIALLRNAATNLGYLRGWLEYRRRPEFRQKHEAYVSGSQ